TTSGELISYSIAQVGTAGVAGTGRDGTRIPHHHRVRDDLAGRARRDRSRLPRRSPAVRPPRVVLRDSDGPVSGGARRSTDRGGDGPIPPLARRQADLRPVAAVRAALRAGGGGVDSAGRQCPAGGGGPAGRLPRPAGPVRRYGGGGVGGRRRPVLRDPGRPGRVHPGTTPVGLPR